MAKIKSKEGLLETMLSLDELKRQLELVSAIQDILNDELKLWTKRLNSYSVYESSGSLDNDTVSLARIKYLKLKVNQLRQTVDNITRLYDKLDPSKL